ncbi:MAG TPA: BrnT family toxin [Blastocatellia bacterium]|nr:BrnT family toxin [Blastocatellia bacterium]
MDLSVEWDDKKAADNLKKHGVSFDEAATVFGDPLAASTADTTHSLDENRFLIIGQSIEPRVLLVVYCEQGDNVRIISARPATRREIEVYEEGEN